MVYAIFAAEYAQEPITIDYHWNVALLDASFWLIPATLIILAVAACLQARLGRHWSLKVFAVAAVLGAVSLIASRIGESPIHGATTEQLVSGERSPIEALMVPAQWLMFIAWACTAVAGLGSIRHALKLMRASKS